jgi:succinate dehydrogenase / fumarate reductase cytochrome b subunit
VILKVKTGFLAWLLHRITGILLVIYLFFHLLALNSGSVISYGKIILFTLIALHAFNGMRVIVIDTGVLLTRQKHLFWGLLIMGIIILLFIFIS